MPEQQVLRHTKMYDALSLPLETYRHVLLNSLTVGIKRLLSLPVNHLFSQPNLALWDNVDIRGMRLTWMEIREYNAVQAHDTKMAVKL